MTANMFVGTRYTETQALPVRDVAQLVRAQVRARIKALKDEGKLPSGTSVRVRYSRASMMQAIDITVSVPPILCLDAQGNPIPGAAKARAATARLCRELAREFEQLAESYNRYSTVSRSNRRFYSDVYVSFPEA